MQLSHPLSHTITTNVFIAIFTNRVEISVTDGLKHTLPVNQTCVWQHLQGLAIHDVGCFSADGGAAKNYFDIWLCMEQAACTINGALHEQTMYRGSVFGTIIV